MTRKRQESVETIPLLRGGTVVGNLLGAFGHGLRETRLTAALGYLIALRPEVFQKVMGSPGSVTSVELEHRHDQGRSDVILQSAVGSVVIEAKVGSSNPRRQAARYPGAVRVLITGYRPSAKETRSGRFRYLTWKMLLPILEELAKDSKAEARAVSQGMIHYMEEHGMIRREDPVEIYAREINEETTLAMFIKAGVYTCEYKAGSRLPEALYFAPHFGASIVRNHPGIHLGISYVARIEKVEVVESWLEIRAALMDHHGKTWFKKHQGIFKSVSWLKQRKKRSLVITSPPQLVFHPPVRKETLQKGSGWLSRNFLSFQELFEARTK
jgi:hypothetical protein